MKNHQSIYVPIIYNLGLMNQYLLSRYIDLRLVKEARQLQEINEHLFWLYKAAVFNFPHQVEHGETLFVGEGNLSFSLGLAKMELINPSHFTATTFETRTEMSEAAQINAQDLKCLGATVLYGVDATLLSATFGRQQFDNIVFQFPNVASRDPIDGHNPNFILVRDFLISASSHLAVGGRVFISAVHSPYYLGAFHFEEAAEAAGFHLPEDYPFDPNAFPDYAHTMTHEDDSALENHDKFSTWIFRLK